MSWCVMIIQNILIYRSINPPGWSSNFHFPIKSLSVPLWLIAPFGSGFQKLASLHDNVSIKGTRSTLGRSMARLAAENERQNTAMFNCWVYDIYKLEWMVVLNQFITLGTVGWTHQSSSTLDTFLKQTVSDLLNLSKLKEFINVSVLRSE